MIHLTTKVSVQAVNKPAGQKRIGICVPMRGTVDANFCASMINIVFHFLQKPNCLPLPIFSEQMPVDAARNEISKQAIISQCDYLFWLDSDIVLTTEMIDHLWNTLHTPEEDGTERQVVCGIYYQRALPYHPVLRRLHKFHRFFDPESILLSPVIEYPRDKLFTVDGAGMGCVLMRAHPHNLVFNDTKGRPFQFVSQKISEDLFFFLKLREGVKDHQGNTVKFNIWVDPRVQCAHIGASVTQWHYLHSQNDRYIDIEELSEYTKQDAETTLQKCLDGALDVMEQWVAKFGRDSEAYKTLTPAQLDDFYRNVNYLHDLTFYWFNDKDHREKPLSKFDFAPDKPFNCLDFGCGIGDFGLNIAERYPASRVIFFDINKKSLEYLRWRIAKRIADGRMKADQAWIIDDPKLLDKLAGIKFDVAFCLDMLEHLKEPTVSEYGRFLYDHLTPQGILIASIAPMKPMQPQHVSAPKLDSFGFVQLDELVYCLPGNEIAAKVKEATGKV